MRRKLSGILAFVLTLSSGAARAQGTEGSPIGDYRPYVFGAYGAAFVILFAFVFLILSRQRKIDREIDSLKDRIERKSSS